MFDEIVQWAGASKQSVPADDLVVIGITDAEGVVDQVKAMLTARNITYITDCSKLLGLTAAHATEMAKLPGGGSVMAIFDCWQENLPTALQTTVVQHTSKKVTEPPMNTRKSIDIIQPEVTEALQNVSNFAAAARARAASSFQGQGRFQG